MNLAIRGIDARIAHGDTFHNDRHPDFKADYALANPPFNDSDWRGELLRDDLRWSRFMHFAPAEMFTVVGEHVFPCLRTDLARQLGNGDSTYAHHMKDAPLATLQHCAFLREL